MNFVALSKFLARALRHEPWLYELELDDQGWTPIDDVLKALWSERREWQGLTDVDLASMIAQSTKRRYEIEGDRIRALYGHSVPGKLKKTPAAPPALLHHGTSPGVLPQIRQAGLLPMRRQYVHLSVDVPTALEVGRRKAKQPVVLRIRAAEAHARGLGFYEGNEKVWLADRVPAEFIDADVPAEHSV